MANILRVNNIIGIRRRLYLYNDTLTFQLNILQSINILLHVIVDIRYLRFTLVLGNRVFILF